ISLNEQDRALVQRCIQGGAVHVAADTAVGRRATSIMVITPGRPGVLALAAGVLALHSLQVHSADIRIVEIAEGTAAVESFTVSPRFGRLPDVALLRQDLMRALDGSLLLADALAAKERDYGEGFTSATGAVILELRTTDRIGLLYRVAAALESNAVIVRWARVATLGTSVVDSFCLNVPAADGVRPGHSVSDGRVALPPEVRDRVERAVLSAAR